MKTTRFNQLIPLALACSLSGWLAGCASSGEKTAATPTAPGGATPLASKYKADDGRTIEIGKCTPSNGGLSFKDPHMEKCWIAADFKFTGFDVLYIAPTMSTAKIHDDEQHPFQLAEENLPIELSRIFVSKGVFPTVVLRESDIKPGARTLKLEDTIIEYSKGGGAARYFVGLYGGGQPVLRVQGKMTDGDKTEFTFEIRRSGTSAGARMAGVFMKDEDIQTEDIRSLALDLADFIAAIEGKYQPK